MDEVDINGEFVLTIIDSRDMFIEQSFTEKFESVDLVKKGQPILANEIAEKNVWLYTVEFNSYINFAEQFRLFVNKLSENILHIDELKSRFETIKIGVFIRSDYAQLGYSVPSEILYDLAKLKLDLEFHVLSFGMV
jgi:hypothetical protein